MSVRQSSQRKLQSACDLLDNVATHLVQVSETYFEPHPEIAKPLTDIVGMLVTIQDCILKVKAEV